MFVEDQEQSVHGLSNCKAPFDRGVRTPSLHGVILLFLVHPLRV